MSASGPFMLVPEAEWAELQRRLRYQQRVLEPVARDKGRHAAETFMSVFEPDRANEWGHVAYCIEVALSTRKNDAL